MELRRPLLNFEQVPDNEIRQALGSTYEADYGSLKRDILRFVFFEPEFNAMQNMLAKMIYELHNDSEARTLLGLTGPLFLAYLQDIATQWGLLLGEDVRRMQKGERVTPIVDEGKYLTREELFAQAEKWKREGKTVGIVHGAFDPPHVGHARLFAHMHQATDVLLVGVDNDTNLQGRKGAGRPRFPLAGRLYNIASLPTVDYVFRMPIDVDSDEAYEELYQKLGVRVVGSGSDNRFLPNYQARMRKVGGVVVANDFSTERLHSSTGLIDKLGNVELAENILGDPNLFERRYQWLTEQAALAGFLRE